MFLERTRQTLLNEVTHAVQRDCFTLRGRGRTVVRDLTFIFYGRN